MLSPDFFCNGRCSGDLWRCAGRGAKGSRAAEDGLTQRRRPTHRGPLISRNSRLPIPHRDRISRTRHAIRRSRNANRSRRRCLRTFRNLEAAKAPLLATSRWCRTSGTAAVLAPNAATGRSVESSPAKDVASSAKPACAKVANRAARPVLSCAAKAAASRVAAEANDAVTLRRATVTGIGDRRRRRR
jgi:hypothetical protein